MPQGVAIVTGAPRRIGRALALAAAGCGYDILIHHRHAETDAQLLADDLAELGVKTAIFAADLADPETAAAIMAEAQKLGPVTLLVNNASLFEEDSLATLTSASWDEHMAVNLRAPVLLTQLMANTLPADLEGLVVNILDQRVLH
ncbi:MAG: SDR family NAD(P)-dependent oxidoreductase, partial [Alphaproteobacteria bacterium]